MDTISSALGQVFVQRSLVEMFLIAIICGVISSYVVLRGVAFLTSALSHAIFPGIVISFILGGDLFWGALVAGLVVVVGVSLVERNRQVSENSAIGVLYIGAFAIGIVLISSLTQSNAAGLENFLFGQLFGIGWSDILSTLLVGIIVVGAIFLLRKEFLLTSFDNTMANAMGYPARWLNLGFLILVTLTVVTGIPAVGNILMIALVITPGAIARLLTRRLPNMMLIGTLSVLIASLVGIFLSYFLDLAPGACVVVVLTALFLLALLFNLARCYKSCTLCC